MFLPERRKPHCPFVLAMKSELTLGIMQPYFFPYLGHFSLIAAVDEWVVFDITQYTPKTWMNRNRILHPVSGWRYVTVPLSNSSISINTIEAKLLDRAGTKVSITRKLSHYRNKAPYFKAVSELVHEVFDASSSDSLVHLNVQALEAVCGYLGIPFRYTICSEHDLKLPTKMAPGGLGIRNMQLVGRFEISESSQWPRYL